MKGNCFVIMPFGGNFDEYWKEIIEPTVEDCGYSPARADSIFGTRSIISDIYEGISSSQLVIADVTDKNPNVAYELGMAHTMGKPVIILTRDINDVPFDFKHIRCIIYDTAKIRWDQKLKEKIKRTVKEVEKDFSKHTVFNKVQIRELSHLREHLKNIIFQIKAVLSKDEEIACDEHGNCHLLQRWKIYPETDLSHFSHNISIGAPGKIEIVRVFDIFNDRSLRTIDFIRTERKLFYGILFDDLKLARSKVMLEIEVHAEHYMAELLEKGEITTFYQGASKSNIRYGNIIQRYSFPNTSRFENMSAFYYEHPNKELSGQDIKILKNNHTIEFIADFSTDEPQQYSFGVTIKLN